MEEMGTEGRSGCWTQKPSLSRLTAGKLTVVHVFPLGLTNVRQLIFNNTNLLTLVPGFELNLEQFSSEPRTRSSCLLEWSLNQSHVCRLCD